ncbi:hypothetical protein Rhow_009023 [Rhodococcus wratislaviensis]|uniref:Uncharacterized protein n=1 Tax=Rhodococcus wratislaviensis TaxID=44752 RepID=A0A402CLN6_RHOWR|nr:hypothetical protein Rhow_009023 [Rhodococcus wratislaviensis]
MALPIGAALLEPRNRVGITEFASVPVHDGWPSVTRIGGCLVTIAAVMLSEFAINKA